MNEAKPVIDIHQIMKYLPHRYPFLLVDRVVACEVGVSIDAYKNVTINEPFFSGHFPGRPVMPGVLMLEALAQTTALLAFHSGAPETDSSAGPKIYLFVGLENVRFKRLVEPGDRLDLHAEVVRVKAGIYKFKTWGSVDGAIAVQAEIMCTARTADQLDASA